MWALHENRSIAVEFKPYRSKLIGKTKSAALGVFVSDADSVFIILFLIFSEVTRRPQVSVLEKMIEGIINIVFHSTGDPAGRV